jgi:O-antigen ligase
MTQPQPESRFSTWMGSMWLYTVLRFGLFFALWGLLALAGVGGLVGAAVALLLSVPLAWVLLARPRARFAAQIEQRVNARKQHRAEFDAELSGRDDERPADR